MWMWWSALISGFDRHLLGLYLIAKEEGLPVPELYTDPLYAKRFGPTLFHFTCIVWCQFDVSSTNVLCVCVSSGGGGNFVLSTSLVGYTTVLGGVAPMVPHGYGFFYRIRDDRFVQKWLLTIPVYCETLGVRKFHLVSEQAKQFMYFNVISHPQFRIVASCTAWKSSPETDAEALFQNLTTSFHDIMHLTTLSNL